MEFRTMSTKALAVFMSLIMLFSFCAPAVGAVIDELDKPDKPELNYVSLGDSMTNGYCFNGYKQDSNDRNVYDLLAGKGVYGEDAYPLQFEAHLSKNYKVNHSKLAVSGMLAENLLFLLGGCEEEVDNGWGGYRSYIGTYTTEELQAHYQEKISEADLISICIGNAAFGAYLVQMLTDIIGVFGAEYEPGKDVSVEGVVELVKSEEFKELILDTNEDIQTKIRPILVEAGFEEEADLLLNQIAYTVISYLVHYGLLIDRIVEMNPDVEIVLVGLFNAMGDITLEYEGEILPFGECMTVVYDVLNAYIAAYPTLKQANGEAAYADATFYYAAQPEAEYIIDVFDDVCNGKADSRLDRDTVRQRTITAYNETLAVMANLYPITLDMVNAYESGKYDWSGKTAIADLLSQNGITITDGHWVYNPVTGDSIDFSDDPSFEYFGGTEADWKLLSVLVYIAIEEALCKSVDHDIISVDSIKAIMNPEELASIFGGVEGMINGYFASFSDTPVADFTAAMNQITPSYTAFMTALMTGAPTEEAEAAFLAVIENAKATCATAKVAGSAEGLLTMLTEFFCQEELAPLCKIFLLFKAGNGMSVHPTPACHDDIAEAVIYAYDNKHTAFKESVKNFTILADLFVQYRDEVYEYAYTEAKKQGVIDDINAYIDEALKAIDSIEAWAYENKNYFRSDEFASQLAISAAEARKTMGALRTLINNADALDETTFNNAIALLEQLENNMSELAALVKIAADDAAEYADIKTAQAMEQMAKAIAVLNAKMNELRAMLCKIEAIVTEQFAIAEELFEKFIAVAEKYLVQINAKKDDLKAYLDVIIRDFLSNDAFSADYRISADSYYLAIGDDTLYAELLAVKLGLGKDQFGMRNWKDLDASVIAKADLITIGYSESMISGFAADQILGYVKNYIDTELRNSVNAYTEAALNEFFKNLNLNFKEGVVEGIIGNALEGVNGIINELVAGEMLTDAKLEELDWVSLVGEENVPYVKNALAAIKKVMIDSGIPQTYIFEQDVAELFFEQLEGMDPEFVSIIEFFDTDSIVRMFGEYTTFTHEIPVMDALLFAVESYLYGYVKFNVEYAQLVYAIGAINPDVQIVLLGNYNAFEDLGLDVVIRDVIIDFSKVLTSDIKASADEKINGSFGVLENATDVNNIASVFDALNARIAEEYEGIKAMQSEVASFDLIAAIKSIEFSDAELESLVGAENVEYAKCLVNIIKYILTEEEVFDAIVEEIPSAEDALGYVFELEAKIDGALADVDIAVEEAFRMLGMTLSEAQAVLGTLSDYIAALKAQTLSVQAYLNSVYDAVANIDITIKGTSFDLGEVLGAPATIHSLLYAFTMKNVIFVDIAEAKPVYEGSAEDFLLAYIFDKSVANVSEEGHVYISEKLFSVLNVKCGHYDLNTDHCCDNLACGVKLSACEDADNNHVCDYCGAEISACADADKNHVCDYCGEVISVCADADNDHCCDYCGEEVSSCEDENKDHKCDVCGADCEQHVAAAGSHNCAYCGQPADSGCKDENKDHKCDVCGEIMTQCADGNNDHYCDVCGTNKLSECVDSDEDGRCDICGADVVGEIGKDGLSTGAVIAIVAVSVVFAGGAGFAIYWFIIRKKLMKA